MKKLKEKQDEKIERLKIDIDGGIFANVLDVQKKINEIIDHIDGNAKSEVSSVKSFLKEVGIPAHLKGYKYLQTAMEILSNDPDIINGRICKGLYPSIAKVHDTATLRAERAIRHSISVAFNRGNIDFINKIFGYSVDHNKSKATNGEFLAVFYEYLEEL